MTIKPITLGSGILFLGILLPTMGNIGHAAPVQAQPSQPVAKAVQRPTTIKRVTKLTTQQAAAVPGETRNVRAVLTTGTTPVAGKTVAFKFEGRTPNGHTIIHVIGQDATNQNGEATIPWKVPEIPQGTYVLKASFAGDDDSGATSDEASFTVVKGITKLELGDVTYSTLDSHGGPKFHTVIVRLRRQADNETLNKTVKVRINDGPEQVVNLGLYGAAMASLVLQPPSASQWTLKAQFEGDDANQATGAQRTYNRVPGS